MLCMRAELAHFVGHGWRHREHGLRSRTEAGRGDGRLHRSQARCRRSDP
jgi:hypothetical protein